MRVKGLEMYRTTIMIVALSLCILPATLTQAETNSGSDVNTKVTAVTIVLTNVNLTEKILELSYQIKNDSGQDIWLYESSSLDYNNNFEVAMAEEGQTLLIRRRLDVPITGFPVEQPFGRYIRIPKSGSRKRSLLLLLPVRSHRVLLARRRTSKVIQYAKCLVIEIGFYSGDLPGMIVDMLEEAERDPKKKHVNDWGYPIDAIGWLDSSVHFNRINEGVQDRGEQLVIPWTNQTLKGEQVLRTTADDLHIPYIEDPAPLEFRPLNLNLCTKVKIKYQPSMLDYFFPYTNQQSLLSAAEVKHLQSHETVVVDDKKLIIAMADEINKGFYGGQLVTESWSAHVACYRGDEHLTSFTMYGDTSVETEDKQYLWYRLLYRRGLQAMRTLTPQVEPFELRVQCANNLVDLWHRLRLYHKAEKIRLKDSSGENQIVYPAVDEWCDVMVRAYRIVGPKKWIIRVHNCPSASEGKNHYAMNPNCKPDSPPDMVLLFETKGGWNQHGGPELFTFDNHDPRGGCVLLNDGTVKFIRTREELHQLRWK